MTPEMTLTLQDGTVLRSGRNFEIDTVDQGYDVKVVYEFRERVGGPVSTHVDVRLTGIAFDPDAEIAEAYLRIDLRAWRSLSVFVVGPNVIRLQQTECIALLGA
jgi:hypothetical protein